MRRSIRVAWLAAMSLLALAASRPDARAADLDPMFDPKPMNQGWSLFTPQQLGWEVRGGVFAHSPGFQEAGSADLNLELMTPRLSLPVSGVLTFFVPRLQVGGFLNTAGKTSYAYGGFIWTFDITPKFFFEPMFGAAVHNGELDTADPTRVSLGCRALFHTGVNFGYRFTETWSIVGTWDHISNANTCSRNVGLNTYGVKLGYRF